MHEFETAVVNEPSVFDPLKFYSMSLYIIVTIPVYREIITLVFRYHPIYQFDSPISDRGCQRSDIGRGLINWVIT